MGFSQAGAGAGRFGLISAADRVAPALLTALEGLKLARRELAGTAEDGERWRWVAVGLVSALKAAAIAALSGYETARPEDAEDPASPGKMAPLALLLRRVRSERYLGAPERLEATGGQVDAALRLQAYRNEAVHGLGGQRPDTIAADARTVLTMIAQLLVEAPAFDPAGNGVLLALISDEATAVQAALAAYG